MSDQPWETYSRGRLRQGFAYPVGRPVIEDELRAAGVSVESLNLSCPTPAFWAEWSILVTARWYPRNINRRRGGAGLTVHAVGRHSRAAVTRLLEGGVLRSACDWLARAAGDPDSAWAGSSHQWQARLVDGVVTIDAD